MKTHEFTAGFLSAGMGIGALGFVRALARLGPDAARFKNLGGVDIDPDACADFEYLTGAPALCADLFTLQPHELRALWGPRRPDAVFSSPPCKGFSRLIGQKAAGAPKYQKLNTLVHVELSLVLAAYPNDPPPLLVIENVPGIASRGKHLLIEVRRNAAAAGYRFHEATHDCGEIGNLAQHRRRFLMVMRLERSLQAYVYQPPKHPVRGCGEELGKLLMPEDPAAGPLHKLPKISLLNHVRLGIIPAGGDWRDLPKRLEPAPGNDRKHESKYRVTPFDAPAHAVTAASRPGSGAPSVADPRVAVTDSGVRHTNKFEVQRFDEPVRTITSVAGVSTGAPNVADPRIPLAMDGEGFKGSPGLYGVLDSAQPAQSITASMSVSGSNTPAAVADPRVPLAHEPRRDTFGVTSFDEPADAVRGNMSVRQARAAVADPRLQSPMKPGQARREFFRRDPVMAWTQPSDAVTGPGGTNAAQNVADPRVELTCHVRNGAYGVLDWKAPSTTVTGTSHGWDNGAASVADPRKPVQVVTLEAALELLAATPDARKPPAARLVIVAADGTWHRPLTDLDLAVLQGLPPVVNGKPLQLSRVKLPKGVERMSNVRERIGNGVPVGAGEAIASSLLKALLAGKLGTWFLSSDEVWVRRRDGAREDDARFNRFEVEVPAHG